MIHLALWLVSFIIVLAIGIPLALIALRLLVSKIVWAIVGLLLILVSVALMHSNHALAVSLLVIGSMLTLPVLTAA